jgi:hypothetical protein
MSFDNKIFKSFRKENVETKVNQSNNNMSGLSQNYLLNIMSPSKKLKLLDNNINTTKSINTTTNPLLSDNLNNIFDKLNQINNVEQTTNLRKIAKQKTFKEDNLNRDLIRIISKRNKIVKCYFI